MTHHEFSPEIGVVIVDHGSKFPEANALLEEVAALYREVSGAAIVEHAHMELAEPTIDQAFDRCVAQGARMVIVSLFFLSPGRHGKSDIPRMAAEAAARCPGVQCRVAEPLGADPALAALLHRRVLEAIAGP